MPKFQALLDNFPFKEVHPIQREALREIAEHENTMVLEMGTGEGKSAIGYATLRAEATERNGPVMYITPSKTLVDQMKRIHPDVVTIMGRSEYSCLYYATKGEELNAAESPCYMLQCPHRVNQETGETEEDGVEPCPYFRAKYDAMKSAEDGKVIVTTMAFFLRNRLGVNWWKDFEPGHIVVDEAHMIAKVARGIFEQVVTEYHLQKCIEVLRGYDREQALVIAKFRQKFMRIVRRRASSKPILMKEDELRSLLDTLEGVNANRIAASAKQAIRDGHIDPRTDRAALKALESLSQGIPRIVSSLKYCLDEEDRNPLSYVVGFYYKAEEDGAEPNRRKANYRLVIKSYFVSPLIKKALGKRVLAYSATIGNPGIFKFETGIGGAFSSFESSFEAANSRIYLPTDSPDLSMKKRRRDDLKKAIKRMVLTAKEFAELGVRSLAVVVSEDERQQYLRRAELEKLEGVLTYGNGRSAREIAGAFTHGEGTVLLGTVAQYGQGVDLDRGMAPVICFLRPGYPSPDDPEAQFEERRFGASQRWALWNWRVLIEALQVRGRNLRGAGDLGVCFFMSMQFKRILGGLPNSMARSYKYQINHAESVADARKLLGV